MLTFVLFALALLATAGAGAWFITSVDRGAEWAVELTRAQSLLPSPSTF